MSMLCTVARISSDQIDAILNDPHAVAEMLDEISPHAIKPAGLFARLFGGKTASEEPIRPRKFAIIPDSDRFEVDKQWDILHYLLTGPSEGAELPGAFLCSGGHEVGRDLGYGSPRLFDVIQTKKIAAYLKHFSFQVFSERYQPDQIELAQIYWKAGQSDEEREDEIRGLWQVHGELASFLDHTAVSSGGILVEIY